MNCSDAKQRLQFLDTLRRLPAQDCEEQAAARPARSPAGLPQQGNCLVVQRLPQLATLFSGLPESRSGLGQDANAVVGGGRLNPHERLLVLGQQLAGSGAGGPRRVAFSG